MKSLKTKMAVWGAAALVALGGFAVIAHAQGPAEGRHGGAGLGPGGGFLAGMMGHALNLTDAQKTQIHAVVNDAFASNQALATQMKAARDTEQAAIKAGKSDAELAQLAQSYSALQTQFHTVRLQTEAKVYKLLTPDQQAKLDQIRADMQARFANRAQHFRQGHRGTAPAPAATPQVQ